MREILQSEPPVAPEQQLRYSLGVFKETFDQFGDKLKKEFDSSSDQDCNSVVDLEELNSSKINLPDPEKLEEEERDFLEEQRRDKRKINSAGSSGSPGMVSSRRDDTVILGKMPALLEASPLRNQRQ